jgi:hypothetical protein
VITKKLVTFRDIEELHENNVKLLTVIRDLSEECEKSETKLKECNKEEMEVRDFFAVSTLGDACSRRDRLTFSVLGAG